MYPQGLCRILKPAYAGNGCAIFPAFENARIEEKIRCPAADNLFRVSSIPEFCFLCQKRLDFLRFFRQYNTFIHVAYSYGGVI